MVAQLQRLTFLLYHNYKNVIANTLFSMRITGTSQREKYDERKKKTKKMQVAPSGCEPAAQLPPAHKVRPSTTGRDDHTTQFKP